MDITSPDAIRRACIHIVSYLTKYRYTMVDVCCLHLSHTEYPPSRDSMP